MDAADHPVVLFDGVCNYCNALVNFIIDHDPDSVFRFAPLQSEAAAQALRAAGQTEPPGLDSVILVDGGHVYRNSDAGLRIYPKLRGPIRLLGIGLIVPRFIRDGVYRFIARNRYRWFGKTEACRVPTAELRARFL